MTVLNQVIVEVLNVVERGLDQGKLVPRQTATLLFPTPLSQPETAVPTPAMTQPNNNPSGPTSSPLLFFVALGFGVVFTNLWIIVGVKYCFRYNARNRAIRNGEDPDPISMENMPTRPHRRRREKKLMTMEEVNERFPLTKYKTWVASRAREGLPTNGGVTAPPSRPGSVREVDGVMPSSPTGTKHSVNTRPDTAGSERELTFSPGSNNLGGQFGTDQKGVDVTIGEKGGIASPTIEEKNRLEEVTTTTETIKKHPSTSSEDDDDEDDHIHTAVPPELLTNPGDSCAICIDTLEDDDDIRGLTCVHAFHAGCLDPWLTSRRACCPLCKADYYTPKPRPEGEIAEPDRTGRRRANHTQQPATVWLAIRTNRFLLPGRFGRGRGPVPGYGADGANDPPYPGRVGRRSRRQAAAAQPANITGRPAQSSIGADQNAQAGAPSRWNPFSNMAMPNMRLPRRNQQAPVEASPSQLEAGTVR